MNEINLATWEDFASQLKELHKKHESAPLLFRGQSDSSWHLETTLERAGQKDLRFMTYYERIHRAKSEIETFSGRRWKIFSYPKMATYFNDAYNLPILPTPVYQYVLHLRHHAFPSPLLDWSRSPYVAAYFAFRPAMTKGAESRSIYVFCERPEGVKSSSGGEPRIITLGPYVRSHPRHFLQQSAYSMCLIFTDSWRFAPHEDVFMHGQQLGGPVQDLLWKFNIPSTERPKVLKLLDDHNLNAYSLFGTEESLMETMAVRLFDL